ncbi:MAG: 23S rRNA (cytidine(2498)-2'-O)-methyltransferase RlmM, partial [Pseudomonadota bacterium]|nr:23S rRNA (cytidine(2498)-2'-O)-methyltransferase RlmM [Pseudomonadota bacterium]
MNGLLCYCRAGFEPELAGELTERAAQAGFAGYARTERNSGYVLFVCDDADRLSRAMPWSTLIYARQKLRLFADLQGLDPSDRITPMSAALPKDIRFGELVMEHPDSDASKPLAGLARSLGNALRPALRKSGALTKEDNPRLQRLHVCMLDGDHALLASSEPEDSSPWPLGIPRLRAQADAPSRSALKLEEALLVLLDERERSTMSHDGMRAADLGAAPGGWTWVLMRKGLRVQAIDNGPMQ